MNMIDAVYTVIKDYALDKAKHKDNYIRSNGQFHYYAPIMPHILQLYGKDKGWDLPLDLIREALEYLVDRGKLEKFTESDNIYWITERLANEREL